MMKNAVKNLLNQEGASEIVQTGLITLFGAVVCLAAYILINPSIDTGIATLTGQITSAFTSIAGL